MSVSKKNLNLEFNDNLVIDYGAGKGDGNNNCAPLVILEAVNFALATGKFEEAGFKREENPLRTFCYYIETNDLQNDHTLEEMTRSDKIQLGGRVRMFCSWLINQENPYSAVQLYRENKKNMLLSIITDYIKGTINYSDDIIKDCIKAMPILNDSKFVNKNTYDEKDFEIKLKKVMEEEILVGLTEEERMGIRKEAKTFEEFFEKIVQKKAEKAKNEKLSASHSQRPTDDPEYGETFFKYFLDNIFNKSSTIEFSLDEISLCFNALQISFETHTKDPETNMYGCGQNSNTDIFGKPTTHVRLKNQDNNHWVIQANSQEQYDNFTNNLPNKPNESLKPKQQIPPSPKNDNTLNFNQNAENKIKQILNEKYLLPRRFIEKGDYLNNLDIILYENDDEGNAKIIYNHILNNEILRGKPSPSMLLAAERGAKLQQEASINLEEKESTDIADIADPLAVLDKAVLAKMYKKHQSTQDVDVDVNVIVQYLGKDFPDNPRKCDLLNQLYDEAYDELTPEERNKIDEYDATFKYRQTLIKQKQQQKQNATSKFAEKLKELSPIEEYKIKTEAKWNEFMESIKENEQIIFEGGATYNLKRTNANSEESIQLLKESKDKKESKNKKEILIATIKKIKSQPGEAIADSIQVTFKKSSDTAETNLQDIIATLMLLKKANSDEPLEISGSGKNPEAARKFIYFAVKLGFKIDKQSLKTYGIKDTDIQKLNKIAKPELISNESKATSQNKEKPELISNESKATSQNKDKSSNKAPTSKDKIFITDLLDEFNTWHSNLTTQLHTPIINRTSNPNTQVRSKSKTEGIAHSKNFPRKDRANSAPPPNLNKTTKANPTKKPQN